MTRTNQIDTIWLVSLPSSPMRISVMDTDHIVSPHQTNNIIYHFRSFAEIVTVFMLSFTEHMPLNIQAICKKKQQLRKDHPSRITSMSFLKNLLRFNAPITWSSRNSNSNDWSISVCASVATNVLSLYRFMFLSVQGRTVRLQSIWSVASIRQQPWRKTKKSIGFDYAY